MVVSEDTKTQLLDSAEQLFAERGIEATSVRDITKAAASNVAAVNYHFGSKDGLVRALFSRRLGPVTIERARLLDAAMARRQPRLREIIDAFVTPVIDMYVDDPHGGRNFVTIVGRSLSPPRPALTPIIERELGGTVERFVDALVRAMPELDRVEIAWRFHLAIGSLNHFLACSHVLEWISDGACDLEDREGIRRRLIDFIVGGIRAGRPTSRKGGRS